jgi:hypothetical protein
MTIGFSEAATIKSFPDLKCRRIFPGPDEIAFSLSNFHKPSRAKVFSGDFIGS